MQNDEYLQRDTLPIVREEEHDPLLLWVAILIVSRRAMRDAQFLHPHASPMRSPMMQHLPCQGFLQLLARCGAIYVLRDHALVSSVQYRQIQLRTCADLRADQFRHLQHQSLHIPMGHHQTTCPSSLQQR